MQTFDVDGDIARELSASRPSEEHITLYTAIKAYLNCCTGSATYQKADMLSRLASFLFPSATPSTSERNATPLRGHASRTTTLRQRGPIFALPEDVLVAVFTAVCAPPCRQIDAPLLLCRICRHWRIVARGHAKLWTEVHLDNLNRAKAYVALSQRAGLSVLSGFWDPEYVRGELDWIWPHAHRFEKLHLSTSSSMVLHILEHLGEVLPMLTTLVVSPTSSIPLIHLPVKLPKLVSLTLNSVEVSVQNFADAFTEAVALEKASFTHVKFDGSRRDDRPSVGPRPQGRLRELSMTQIGTRAQAFILDVFTVPSSAIYIEEDTNDDHDADNNDPCAWEKILHPSLAARLRPIAFASLSYRVSEIMLTENDVSGMQRGALTLRVNIDRDVIRQLERKTVMFDLSHVHTLCPNHLYFSMTGPGFATLGQNGFTGGTRPLADSVTTLVLPAGIWYDANLLLGLRALHTILLNFPWGLREETAVIKGFVECLRKRHSTPNEGVLQRVTRVVVEMDRWRKRLSREEIELLESVQGLGFKGEIN